MRKKKFGKVRFLVALGVSGITWIIGLFAMDTHTFVVDARGIIVPIYPHPLIVVFITTVVLGITAYMWRWYRMDRVQRVLTSLNEAERGELIQRLAQSMHIEPAKAKNVERLNLNEEGELEETGTTHQHQNTHTMRGTKK